MNRCKQVAKETFEYIDGKWQKVAAVGTGLALSTGSAFAALPATIATEAATTAADALTLGGIVLSLIVGIALFKHLRSAK